MFSLFYRVAEFDKSLGSEVIDLEFLREQSYRGIPEGGGRRATAWRILLGYLPARRNMWEEACQAKRDLYSQLVGECCILYSEHPAHSDPVLSHSGDDPG